MKKRSYKITCCLGAGYSGEGELRTVEYAEQVIEEWMNSRLEQGLSIINGMVLSGNLFFASKGRRSDGKLATKSPTVQYIGDLSSEVENDRGYDDIKEALESLATLLKEKMDQERVYIIFEEQNWFV